MGHEREVSRRTALKIGLAATASVLVPELTVDAIYLANGEKIYYPMHEIPIRGLKGDCFVVHFTDTHFGGRGANLVNEEICLQVANGITERLHSCGAKEKNTILAITGDAVIARYEEHTPVSQFEACTKVLCNVPAGKRVAVPGNHEIIHPELGAIRQYYQRLGFDLVGWDGLNRMQAESSDLPVQIIGTPDYTTTDITGFYGSIPDNIWALDTEKPVLVLTHNATPFDPKLNPFGWVEALSKRDKGVFIMAGHTHGGQFHGCSIFQWLGEKIALESIGYRSNLVTGICKVSDNVDIMLCNGLGSAGTKYRTAKREVGFYWLKAV